jgi:DNA end-binding protein Ku
MQRSMWSGSITFGLVNVPVRMYSAVHPKSVHFHMLTKDGSCRLRRKLYCPDTGEEYDYKDTARGYEIAPDQYVLIDPEELEALKPESARTIEITDFVDLHQIDPIYYNSTYFLGPGKDGEKPYKLLHDAMQDAQKVGIAKFVMREKEYLAAIRPVERGLCLETMYFADEVGALNDVPGLPVAARVQKKEVEIARKLIDTLATDFKPEKYHERYREQVLAMIKKKAKGQEIVAPQSREAEAPPVYNLMKALEESLKSAQRKGHTSHSHTQRRRKSA